MPVYWSHLPRQCLILILTAGDDYSLEFMGSILGRESNLRKATSRPSVECAKSEEMRTGGPRTQDFHPQNAITLRFEPLHATITTFKQYVRPVEQAIGQSGGPSGGPSGDDGRA